MHALTTSFLRHGKRPLSAALVVCSFFMASTGHAGVTVAEKPDPQASQDLALDRRSTELLRIAVEPTVADPELLDEWIRSRNGDALEQMRSVEDDDQWISVEISGVTYDYQISVVAMRGDEPVMNHEEPLRCECTNEQLLELVDDQIDAAVAMLRASQTGVKRLPAQPPLPTVVDIRAPSIVLRSAGVGVAVVGAGSFALGVALAVQDDELRGGIGRGSGYTTKPPGIALAVAGCVVLVAGIALVIVDTMRQRKSFAVIPTLGSNQVGWSIVRRF